MKYTDEYLAGYDAAINGPNISNCSFVHFSTPEKTKQWEAGNKAGKAEQSLTSKTPTK